MHQWPLANSRPRQASEVSGCRLRYRSCASAAWAALYPHIPWALAPGGVAAEHR
jgi:hypothetical protein